MATINQDPWLSTEEACEHTGWTLRTLYRRVSERKVRFAKDEGRLKFRRSWLDEYMRDREQPPVRREKAVA